MRRKVPQKPIKASLASGLDLTSSLNSKVSYFLGCWVTLSTSSQIQIIFRLYNKSRSDDNSIIQAIQNIIKQMTSFTNKLGVLSLIGSITLLAPKSFSIIFFITGILTIFLVKHLQKWWIQGQPNEWVLVIKNGKMVRSGIGLKTLVFPNESYVKFPSRVERVQFKAENVTKENQGVQIQGFAFWSVFRQGNGPFKCYKYMQGGNPNANVRTMCESVIRNQLANSTLMEVLKNRNLIRDNMKRDLENQLAGWGIWLETVQLTEVRICSKRLFEDLQADFRQTLRSKAETITLQSNEKLSELKLQSNQKLSGIRENRDTESLVITSNESIKRVEESAKSAQRTYELDKRRVQKQKQVRLANINKNQELQMKSIEYQQQLQKSKKDFEVRTFELEIKNLETHTDFTLQKYAIDAASRTFDRSYRTIQISQFRGQEEGLAKLLPGLQATSLALGH